MSAVEEAEELLSCEQEGQTVGLGGWDVAIPMALPGSSWTKHLQSVISHLKLCHTMAPGGVKSPGHKDFNRKCGELGSVSRDNADHCLRLFPRCGRMLCLSRDTAAADSSYKFISEGLNEESLLSSD